MNSRTAARVLADAGSALAVALTAHTAYNLTQLRTPRTEPPTVGERVSILIPARNEAHRIAPCLEALLRQDGLADVEIVLLDDESTDGTAELARTLGGDRINVISGTPRPEGWLGKPWACEQLASVATGSVLVFVDADVVVEPLGIASSIDLLRSATLDAVCPYPRQVALTPAERLVQPLLQWSWLTTLPLTLAESSDRPSLTAANGQLMLVDAHAYRRAGGHAALADEVLDDIALMRRIKQAGGRGTVADGTHVAHCRMYEDWDDLRAGYTKSLWSAFGPPAAATAVIGTLALAYIVPPVAALSGRRSAAIGTAAAILGRALVAKRTGGRVFPDALSHPASVAVLGYLTVASHRAHRRGTLRWKDRTLDA